MSLLFTNMAPAPEILVFIDSYCKLLQIIIVNNTATIIENIILFDVLSYA